MRSRGRTRRGPTIRQFNALKAAMSGSKLTMKREHAPPAISARPYNSLCLKIFIQPEGALKLISTETLADALVAQTGIGPQAKPKVNLKLRSVKAWAIAVATMPDPPTVRLNVAAINGFVPQSSSGATSFHPYQVELADTGSLSEAAKVGYVYPAAQQKVPVPIDAEFTMFAVSGNTPSVVLHIDLAWSLTDVAPLPTVEAPAGEPTTASRD